MFLPWMMLSTAPEQGICGLVTSWTKEYWGLVAQLDGVVGGLKQSPGSVNQCPGSVLQIGAAPPISLLYELLKHLTSIIQFLVFPVLRNPTIQFPGLVV
jgi:hypothetical protein